MKKALLIGSSFSAMPIMQELRNSSIEVSVCGAFKKDPCHSYTNNSYFIDYSIKEDLFDLVKNNNFDYLVPTCNDASYNSCSWVQQKLGKYFGFDEFSTTEILHNKKNFRNYLKRNNLPSPEFENSDDLYIKKSHPLPCIVKPVDSFSGKGISLVRKKNEFNFAVEKAKSNSINNNYVVEEYVQGSLHSHSAFIRNKEIFVDFFVDEFCTVYPYQVDCSNHPSRLDSSIKKKIKDSINFIIKDLNLCDGLIHTQLIVKNSNFWIIETMRRAPGDLYGYLIEYSSGINYWEKYTNPFIEKKIEKEAGNKEDKLIARHTISSNKLISLKSFKTSISPKSIEVFQLKNSGMELESAPLDKMSIVFLEFSNLQELFSNSSNLAKNILIQNYGLEKNE